MNMAPGASYTLAADIDASATALAVANGSSDIWSTGGGFVPIANFSGALDGLGHTISNLTIYLPFVSKVGVFGVIQPGSTIQNVELIGGSVTGDSYVGGLAGPHFSTINNVHSTSPA